MKNNSKNKLDPKERILNSAMNEFSLNGLKGSRVENITKSAKINKAMLFYYFGSKQNLYEIIIKNTVKILIDKISDILHPSLSIEDFIEKFPVLYIDFFSKNRGLINMLLTDLIQNPNYIGNLVSKLFKENFGNGPSPFEILVSIWYKEGRITEKDPVHFMLNIMSLILFPFIIKPIPEAIFNKKIEETKKYFDYRKKSIQNLLKRGLLK